MIRARAGGKARRGYLAAALVVFAVFVGDIMIAKIQVLLGWTLPIHLGDTVQFLVLLAAVTLFVMGALVREKDEKKSDDLQRQQDALLTQGRALNNNYHFRRNTDD